MSKFKVPAGMPSKVISLDNKLYDSFVVQVAEEIILNTPDPLACVTELEKALGSRGVQHGTKTPHDRLLL